MIKIHLVSQVVSVPVLELDIDWPFAWPVPQSFDTVNVQLKFPWQLSSCRPALRSGDDFGTRFEGMVDFSDRWAFLRSPAPAFLKDTPNQIIKHTMRSHRNIPHHFTWRAARAALPVRHYPSQDLGRLT